MAQDGDTITYTYNGGTTPDEIRVSEDISGINVIEIDYIDSAGGSSSDSSVSGGNGGRVENVVADVSGFNTLYLWVSGEVYGRYEVSAGIFLVPIQDGGAFAADHGGGSSEVSVLQTDYNDSSTEPFIAGAGGGGGAGGSGESGARGVRSFSDSPTSEGENPPLGGVGGEIASDGGDGGGAVSGHGSSVPIIDSGTTIKGGGSGSGTAGEIQITFQKALEPVQSVSKVIKGANVKLNWNNAQDKGELEVQRSTDGFQTVETVESGLPGNTPSFVDRGPQRSQQVEYRVVRQDGNDTAESNSVQAKLSKFTEVPDAELSTNNKPVFTNIGIPNSASKIKIYRATGVEPVFPGDYSVVQESSSQIAKFRDDAAPSESISSYAFTTIDSNGNESSPDIRQIFAPANDAAVLRK